MSVRVRVKTDRTGIRRVLRSDMLDRELERRADRVLGTARATAPVKTGEYLRGLDKERLRGRAVGWRVIARAPHSLIVERGSRPHTIEPKNKKALHWDGANHPVRRVHHPGTPAMHILRNALRAAAN